MCEDKSLQLCRLCLKTGDCPIDIFDPKGANGLLVWEIIKEFTEIETCRSDGLPPTICEDCMKKLTDFKYFKSMCIDSRMKFLLCRINDGLVVHMTENESGPLRDVFCGQGDVHAGGTWSNLEAGEIESEVLIKMEEVDLDEQTENILPNSCVESMEDENSELADVESQTQDVFEEPLPEEEDYLISDGNCSDGEVHCSDVHSSEYVMHVKHEDFGQEIHPPEEYLPSSEGKHSSGEVQRSDVCGSAPEVTMNGEELMDQDGLCLYLFSSSSDEGSDVEECALIATGPEADMHVKHEHVENEIPSPEEYLSVNSEKGSVEEVQCSDVHGIASEVTKDEEELMDQDDLGLQLSSSSSDEGSDVKEHAIGITGRGPEVTDLNCADEISVPVNGSMVRLGNSEETLIREKGPCRVKVKGHQRSAANEHNAMMPVVTHSRFKQRILRSHHCRDENYRPDEDIESTPQSTSGKLFCEENGGHTQRKGELKTKSRHSIGGHDKNISIGSCVGEEKSEGHDYKCDACHKVFKSKDVIKRHFKVPCRRELIDCGMCSEMFRNRNEYMVHKSHHCGNIVSRRIVACGVAVDMRGESKGKRQIKKRSPATCHICNKEFSQMGNLKVHIKTVHLKERKFSCGICGMDFGKKHHLQTHMRYHSGVKPYKCGHCEKGFTQSGNLGKHILAVHKMEKSHTCGECGKAFCHKGHLKRHILIHTGERPHTCDICSRSFSRKNHLESHKLIHTGEKPHNCTLCSKAFRCKDKLTRHMGTHARNVPHP